MYILRILRVLCRRKILEAAIKIAFIRQRQGPRHERGARLKPMRLVCKGSTYKIKQCCLRMDFAAVSSSPLIGVQTHSETSRHAWYEMWSLPLCMVSSGMGMLVLKMSERIESPACMAVGYTLEMLAFGVYPLALRYASLRLVSTLWAASSTATALFGGWALYGEVPSYTSLAGCATVVVGVALVSFG